MTKRSRTKKTELLIQMLGNHKKTSKPGKTRKKRRVLRSTDKQLTLYELGALIVVAGTEAGFDVYTEFPVKVGTFADGRRRNGNLDCAWFSKENARNMIVAWEIDAQDVGMAHLKGSIDDDQIAIKLGNELKFRKSRAKIKVQALYSIRGHLLTSKPHAKDHFDGSPVEVFSDVELMGDQLQAIVRRAKHVAKTIKLPAKPKRGR
jgi:hypothetical protein